MCHGFSLFTIISGAINIGLNYIFIPKFGYAAAAWTTLVSYAALFMLHYINVKFILKITNMIRFRFVALPIGVTLIFLFIFFHLNQSSISYFIMLITKIALIVITAFVFKVGHSKFNEISKK